jgi:hypothetical protein
MFDRIKTDVGGSKANRVFHIKLVGDEEDASKKDNQWIELATRIKECLAASCEMCIADYEKLVSNVDAQRILSGWNYYTFFLLKARNIGV